MPLFILLMAAAAVPVALGGAQGPAPAGKPLDIVKTTLHQYEDGPAVSGSYVWTPGEMVHLTFLVGGARAGSENQVKLRYEVNATDPDGVKLMETVTGSVDVELTAEDKDWLPKGRAVAPIPPLASSGDYRLEISVKDEIAGSSAAKKLTLPVQSRRVVPPSESLVLRNFRYLRGEEDGPPLTEPVYRPGDAVWARFEVTGYRFGEKNSMDVEYGLAVESPEGKVVYTEPRAAVVQDSTYYPKRYVLGLLSVTTRPNTARGTYALVVTAKDNVGGQTYQERHPFRLE